MTARKSLPDKSGGLVIAAVAGQARFIGYHRQQIPQRFFAIAARHLPGLDRLGIPEGGQLERLKAVGAVVRITVTQGNLTNVIVGAAGEPESHLGGGHLGDQFFIVLRFRRHASGKIVTGFNDLSGNRAGIIHGTLENQFLFTAIAAEGQGHKQCHQQQRRNNVVFGVDA